MIFKLSALPFSSPTTSFSTRDSSWNQLEVGDRCFYYPSRSFTSPNDIEFSKKKTDMCSDPTRYGKIKLGEGNSGVTFLVNAQDETGIPIQLVIKEPKDEISAQDGIHGGRFQKEMDNLLLLKAKGVPVPDCYGLTTNGSLVMSFSGIPLDETSLKPNQALLLIEALLALSTACYGHNDLKPGNICFDSRTNRLTLIDGGNIQPFFDLTTHDTPHPIPLPPGTPGYTSRGQVCHLYSVISRKSTDRQAVAEIFSRAFLGVSAATLISPRAPLEILEPTSQMLHVGMTASLPITPTVPNFELAPKFKNLFKEKYEDIVTLLVERLCSLGSSDQYDDEEALPPSPFSRSLNTAAFKRLETVVDDSELSPDDSPRFRKKLLSEGTSRSAESPCLELSSTISPHAPFAGWGTVALVLMLYDPEAKISLEDILGHAKKIFLVPE